MAMRNAGKMDLDLRIGSKKMAQVDYVSSPIAGKKKRPKALPATEEFMDLLHQVKQVEEIKEIKRTTTNTWKEWWLLQWNDGFLQPLTIWVLWLLTGTMYFANVDYDGNYYHGFYYSISVGYCVGWGVLTPKYRYSKVFALFFMFCGALFVLHYVTVLIQLAIAENENTYEQLKIKKNIERSCTLKGWQKDMYVYLAMHNEKLFVIYVWVFFVLVGAFITVAVVKWTWLDGVYFAVTSMSTAGIYGIPKDSPDFLYLLVGLFTATGVPTMALAVSNIGRLIMEARAEARVEAIINQETQITRKEVIDVLKLKEHNSKLFQKNGGSTRICVIHDHDASASGGGSTSTGVELTTTAAAAGGGVSEATSGFTSPTSPTSSTSPGSEETTLDRNEFLIVSLIRMKIIDIELIHDVLSKFDRVDTKGVGELTLKMVKGNHDTTSSSSSSSGGATSSPAPLEEQPYIVREFANASGGIVNNSGNSSGGDVKSEPDEDGAVEKGGLIKDGYQYLEDV